jgi:hypothetical protein
MSTWSDSFTYARELVDFYTGTAVHNAPKHTGRLPLSDREYRTSVPPAVLFAAEPYMVSSMMKENIQFRHSNTDLNEQFFGQANMDALQSRIQIEVRQMVGADIGRQSDPDLMLVMRSYYLQYARNDPNDTQAELEDLNARVVAFCSNRIAVEVEAYRHFRKDILDFPDPIARPIHVNIYGTRTGELKSFF